MKRVLIAVSSVAAWLALVGVLAGVGRSAAAAPDAPARVSFTQTLTLDYVYDHETTFADRAYLSQPVGAGKVVDYTWSHVLEQSRRDRERR